MNTIKIKNFILILLALVITSAIYSPGLQGGFHLDDYPNILNNELVYIDNLSATELWQSAMSGSAGPFKRPISMLTFGLNTYFSGKNPFPMKAVNLVIHLLTGILLVLLSRLILKQWKEDQYIKIDENLFSILVGFCWLIHPFNLTGVLYIVQRMTSLASLFAVASIYSYCLLRTKPFTISRGIVLSFLMGVFGILSLLSKEIAILIPFQILVIEVCVFRFKHKHIVEKFYLISFFALSATLPFLYFAFDFISNFDSYKNVYIARHFTLHERLLTETGIVLWYLKMTLVPNISHMGLLLDSFEISHSIVDPPITAAYILSLLVLLGIAIYSLNKKPFISFGILWFYICHSLESTIIPLELAFEHRNYLASYGVVLAFLVTVMHFFKHEKVKLALVICTLWTIALTYTLYLRVGHWEHPLKLAIYDVEYHPNSQRAHMVLAETYETLYLNEKDEKLKNSLFKESLKQLNLAANINPSSLSPKTGKLLLLARHNLNSDSNELDDLYRSLKNGVIDASTVNSLQQLTICLIKSDCTLEHETYLQVFSNTLSNKKIRRLFKSHLLVHYAQYLATVSNNYVDAERFSKEALSVYPSKIYHYNYLLHFLISQNKLEEARRVLKEYKAKDEKNTQLIYIGKWEKLLKE